jgi:YgiT-type zinc finger domain-containing protein
LNDLALARYDGFLEAIMTVDEIAKAIQEAFDTDRVEVTAHFWDELQSDAFLLADVLCALSEISRVVEMGEDYGKCHVCGSVMAERMTDHGVHEADQWLVIRNVPTGVCTRCGEKILRWQVVQGLEELVKRRNETRPASRIEVPVFVF